MRKHDYLQELLELMVANSALTSTSEALQLLEFMGTPEYVEALQRFTAQFASTASTSLVEEARGWMKDLAASTIESMG